MPTTTHRQAGFPLRPQSLAVALLFWLSANSAVLAGSVNAPTTDHEPPALLTGKIYDSASADKKLLFTFRRTATRTNSTINVLREYRRPDGTLVAREKVVYESGRLAVFELDEPPNGAHGKASVRPDSQRSDRTQISFEYTAAGSGGDKPKTAEEALRPDTLVNDMIAPFVLAHWDQLMRGERVEFRYVVIARRETVGFRLVKDSEMTRDGKALVRLRMEASNFVIAQLVDPLFFTAEKDGQHRILDCTGRTTPRVQNGKSWKDLDAFTVYEWP